MSEKTCRKCGHVATYSGMEPQSCMECGAVYRKVEEAMQQASEGRFSQLPRASVSAQLTAGQGGVRRSAVAGVHGFAEQMRSDSLYPFWRKLVGIATVLGYVLAGFMMVGGGDAVSRRCGGRNRWHGGGCIDRVHGAYGQRAVAHAGRPERCQHAHSGACRCWGLTAPGILRPQKNRLGGRLWA